MKENHPYNGTQPTKATAEVQDMRRQFGVKLRAARESTGATTAELARLTRIAEAFINALEDGAFDRLPGAVFGRGFVQSIAKVLKLNATELLSAYEACTKAHAQPAKSISVDIDENIQGTRFNSAKENQPANATPMFGKIKRYAMIGGGVIVLGLAAIVLTVKPPKQSQDNAPVQNAQATTATPAQDSIAAVPATAVATDLASSELPTAEAAAQPVGTPLVVSDAIQEAKQSTVSTPAPVVPTPSAPVVAVVAPAPSISAPVPAVASSAAVTSAAPVAPAAVTPAASTVQKVVMVVSQPVKIKVGTDAEKQVARDLKPDTYEFTFNKQADFLIYDASAVTVSFNGRPVGSLGGKGRIRRVSFASPDAIPPAL